MIKFFTNCWNFFLENNQIYKKKYKLKKKQWNFQRNDQIFQKNDLESDQFSKKGKKIFLKKWNFSGIISNGNEIFGNCQLSGNRNETTSEISIFFLFTLI